jgi:hypothetical protein
MTQQKRNLKQNLFAERRNTILRKVLIVKNSPFQSKLYGIIFSHNLKGELFFVAKGFEAKDLLDLEKDIDLIISDIKMPMM